MSYYECLDCHRVLGESEFYYSDINVKRGRCKRCKGCELIRRQSSLTYHTNELFNLTRRRCKRKGIPFTLTKEWYLEKLSGKCELSGLPFDYYSKSKNPSARAATVDRIDPPVGYTPENCRMICRALNQLLGSWGEPEALGVILPYLRSKGFQVVS